jgi:hypothetical protein
MIEVRRPVGGTGPSLDQRDELQETRSFVPQEFIDFGGVAVIAAVDHRESVELDPVALKDSQALFNAGPSRPAAIVDAVGIVQGSRTVDA